MLAGTDCGRLVSSSAFFSARTLCRKTVPFKKVGRSSYRGIKKEGTEPNVRYWQHPRFQKLADLLRARFAQKKVIRNCQQRGKIPRPLALRLRFRHGFDSLQKSSASPTIHLRNFLLLSKEIGAFPPNSLLQKMWTSLVNKLRLTFLRSPKDVLAVMFTVRGDVEN